jgi:hypothetical protein
MKGVGKAGRELGMTKGRRRRWQESKTATEPRAPRNDEEKKKFLGRRMQDAEEANNLTTIREY